MAAQEAVQDENTPQADEARGASLGGTSAFVTVSARAHALQSTPMRPHASIAGRRRPMTLPGTERDEAWPTHAPQRRSRPPSERAVGY